MKARAESKRPLVLTLGFPHNKIDSEDISVQQVNIFESPYVTIDVK